MNIYLLKPKKVEAASHYDSCVVIAVSLEQAKTTHPNSGVYRWIGTPVETPWEEKYWRDDWDNLRSPTYFVACDEWVNNLDDIEVTLLGIANPSLKPGVIVASWFGYE